MRILIISQYFYPENFKINDVALTLKEKGYEVLLLDSPIISHLIQKLETSNEKIKFTRVDADVVDKLIPLNLYAKSKNDFDNFVLKQINTPPAWFGLKFFNVFGFDESKKANMSSIVYQAFNKINASNEMYLFKSYNQDFEDGFQERDFVYIDDVINILFFLMNNTRSGIYNLGSGESTSFFTLIDNVFKSMQINPNIKFIEMPFGLRDKYQYSTRADLKKIRSMGYKKSFVKISDAVEDYVSNYLILK